MIQQTILFNGFISLLPQKEGMMAEPGQEGKRCDKHRPFHHEGTGWGQDRRPIEWGSPRSKERPQWMGLGSSYFRS